MKRARSLAYLAVPVVVAAAAIAMAAGPHRGATRPAPRCALPNHEYQYRDFSQPVRSISAVGHLVRDRLPLGDMSELAREQLRRTGDGAVLRAAKTFQFVERPRLQIDHCSISQISVNLYENGDWTVHLRADQNPVDDGSSNVDRAMMTNQPTVKLTEHIKRNLFRIRLRCYAAGGEPALDAPLGQPVVIDLGETSFWVQRQEPRWFPWQGNTDMIRRYFDAIDYVEIDFTYGNRAPLTTEEVHVWQKS